MRSNAKIFRIGGIALLVGLFGLWIVPTIFQLRQAINENGGISDSASKEYLELFSAGSRAKLEVFVSRLSKVRSPFTDFSYEKKYSIIVYRIDLAGEISLADLIKEEQGMVMGASGSGYNVNSYKCMDLLYKPGAMAPVSALYLTISGDPEKVLQKNDSIAEYYFRNNEFSLRYGQNGAVDIYTRLRCINFSKSLPKILLFLKRKGKLFFLLASVNEEKDELPENILEELTGMKR